MSALDTRPLPRSHHTRRAPFTDAVNHHIAYIQPQLPEKPKQPPSPPLPRQNSKTTPPSPPNIISDKSGKLQFYRVGFLGEGGFARVYEVKDVRGARIACKVVTKDSLKTKKAKTKLYAEIKIHRSLEHPNIVSFQDCFEDENNVYMTLELCACGSLMDMLRRRHRFTEPEARFFMVQVIGACHYMHTHQVIHRDLKLGNLFLDSSMNIKVGDFGLAALIESPGERKKTICGTPNYIAPEVLFDTANGHSFEVDTWSIGVIIYTLVVGHPPFQTKDVKSIYQRIRDNQYEFPTERSISNDARQLVQQILTPDPQQRPTLQEIIDHQFFVEGTVPSYIPMTAHRSPPDFRHISRQASEVNLKRLRRYALLDEDQAKPIAVPRPVKRVHTSGTGVSLVKSVTSTIQQQEKEFQRAVQPGSPISALLSSARQPLVMSTNPTRESPLMRKLQAAAKESPARTRGGRGLHNIIEEDEDAPVNGRGKGLKEIRNKELDAQKARIVAQMAPPGEDDVAENTKLRDRKREQENVPPVQKEVRAKEKLRDTLKESVPAPTAASSAKFTGFDAAAHVLTLAFDAKAVGKVFRDPRQDAHLPLPHERVFIVSWVDYCNKYGMGYALTDGSVGVHFNDTTTVVLSPDKDHFEYITACSQGTAYVRKSHRLSAYPEELKAKVYLLKNFERYIMDRLYGDYDYTFEDVNRTKGMEWVQKYLRMKHVIVFKMSHDVLQFNFYDHSKLILSSNGLVITHIDKNYKLTKWTLSGVMAQAVRLAANPMAAVEMEPEQLKFHQRLVDKLKYCKEVLVSIRNAVERGEVVGEVREIDEDGIGIGMGMATSMGSIGINAKASKMSLR